MKKIGFVDFYISEWHANHYPAWIADICAENGYDFELAYIFAEQDTSPVDGRSTAEWCREFGVRQCGTIDELCEKSDVIFILAPTNPEKHLAYARAVLPHKKPTYIDKTFATSLDEAKEIFSIARNCGTPFFSSSALRYEESLGDIENCRNMTVFISGASLEEYIIHDIERVVSKLGFGACRILGIANGSQRFFHLRYPDDRSACLVYADFGIPDANIMESANCKKTILPRSDIFKRLLSDILRFFEEKNVSFDTKQTLETMRIRDAVLAADKRCGEWIDF